MPVSTPIPSSLETPTSDLAAGPDLDLCLNVTQIRLIHHYTVVTAKTLAHNSDSEEVFATHLVNTAFHYPFLLHAVLALAALHLSRLEEPTSKLHKEYIVLAEKHHVASLADFRASVSNIDNTNWRAILLFAGALFPYFCTASVSTGNDLEYAFGHFLSNLALTRRVRPMVTGFYDEIMSSELGRIIPEDVKGMNWAVAEAPVETELVQLRKFSEVVHQLYPPDIVDAYGYAIHVLELVFVRAAGSAKRPSDALLKIWIYLVSDRYVELLSERQPGSLIILAHYAVLIRRSEQCWYLEGVAERLLSITDAFVPSEWRSWLEWPKLQIRGDPTTPAST
ncbi:hypothetical protein BDU57DRAFT_453289 [Ampelomyces quisqualis]|uniref:Fungal-specific transcription factor domain-containing protein n=1 Tax=Ampelomyces quisqualis TaxID=50730 RepID=A0A6A5QKE9_AMPQU|nr:hypothetical protein BDU57DRAFT_453289 [Ampelomyces quisqualis]